jgi:small subunit ribosomal protein S5
MSDTENKNLEKAPVTPDEMTMEAVETPVNEEAPASEEAVVPRADISTPHGDRPRGRDGSRPQGRGDRKGPRRDGMREEEKEFKEEMLAVDRVTRVTAGGRQIRFRASVVIGDGKGRIGLGTGKSGEVQSAVEKAIRDAKKNLITFPIVNGTIPHDVFVTFKSSSLYLHPAHPGTGIIA